MAPSSKPSIVVTDDGEHVEWTHTCLATIGRVTHTVPYEGSVFVVTATNPITIKPAIQCQVCKLMGKVIKGRWYNRVDSASYEDTWTP